MNCNNFNNFNTNGDIGVKFEVNLFYATMGLFAMLFVIIVLFTAISPLVLEFEWDTLYYRLTNKTPIAVLFTRIVRHSKRCKYHIYNF
ncbi:hypothetical protein C0J52_25720 [Blattella germanica]|nr:hypothetical protein C0J52_25720 [Blattella germanica]